jgi:hypothetical protein
MNTHERRLKAVLSGRTDSYYGRNNAAGDPVAVESGMQVAAAQQNSGRPFMAPQMFNPAMVAQFTLNFEVYYFTVVTATGVATEILAAALNAALKTKLAAFVFGQSDQQAGYVDQQGRFPLNGWTYGIPFVYGFQNPTEVMDATVEAKFSKGDMVFPFTSALPGAGTTTLGIVVLKCPEVPYSKMLAASNSDGFILNMIRFNLAGSTAIDLAQYRNIINWNIDSMFGAQRGDKISPLASKTPEQFQSDIIDIPLNIQITKEVNFGTYVNYDILNFTWNIFVAKVQKIL